MEGTGIQKLAQVLKILVTITFVCNLLVLLLLPGLCLLRGPGDLAAGIAYFQHEGIVLVLARFFAFFLSSWREVWMFGGTYVAVLTVFLFACGVCSAVVLWQGRRVLDTILKGDTFTFGNAANMKRAAVCCFVIAAAALARTVWGVCFYRSIHALFTYNALFIPIFLMAGLLCLVMSALFRQAAQLKEENDLTI